MDEIYNSLDTNFEVRFREDRIKYDQCGKVIHSPLDIYGDNSTHGMLAFEGHDLTDSDLLLDVRVYYVEFFGYPLTNEETWANPLRALVLSRLGYKNWNWYLSFVGSLPHRSILPGSVTIEADFINNFIKKEQLNYTYIDSEERAGGIFPRLIVEIPNYLITPVILRYWSNEWIFYQVQGYLLPPQCIKLLQEWNTKHRDDNLFREVMDKVFVAFHSYPNEHRHIVLLTNKLSYDEITEMLKLDALQEQARKIGASIKSRL